MIGRPEWEEGMTMVSDAARRGALVDKQFLSKQKRLMGQSRNQGGISSKNVVEGCPTVISHTNGGQNNFSHACKKK